MSALIVHMPAAETSLPAVPQAQRQPLEGGVLDEAAAFTLMNSHFLVAERDGEVGIYRIEDNGTITFLQNEQFLLLLSNVFVQLGGAGPGHPGKTVPVTRFWLSHAKRRVCRRIVFDPSGNIDPRDYNLWQGFAVEPEAGFSKQRRLLRHIYQVVCRRDSKKFNYLIKWLAWAVQNPHRHAEVVVVFKSEAEGCGKSTVGNVLLEIFGACHGLLVDNKEQLLGKFNAHLETTCFVLGEEVLWAGDHKTTDAFKSRVTSGVIPIEGKYRQQRLVPNRLKVMLTTNHDHAVAAGVNARRFFVCDVSDEKARDKAWFDPLYDDLKDGGTAEFLHFLLNLRLGKWHPREVPKTDELVQQQIMSAGSVDQWLLACCEVDGLAGSPYSGGLNAEIATQTLYEAYAGHTRTLGSRVVPLPRFGRLMTELFGPSRRLSATQGTKRSPGYFVPDAAGVRSAVLRRLKTGS
jgi:hypothetical protein